MDILVHHRLICVTRAVSTYCKQDSNLTANYLSPYVMLVHLGRIASNIVYKRSPIPDTQISKDALSIIYRGKTFYIAKFRQGLQDHAQHISTILTEKILCGYEFDPSLPSDLCNDLGNCTRGFLFVNRFGKDLWHMRHLIRDKSIQWYQNHHTRFQTMNRKPLTHWLHNCDEFRRGLCFLSNVYAGPTT